MEQGSLSQTHNVSNSSINSNSKIDVNTDTLQKLVLSAQAEAADQVKGADDTSKAKEPTSVLQQLLKGNEKEAKQELLKEFIHKVAGSESDILFSADKGNKDVELMGELKLLFGKDAIKNDEVVISSQARMMGMSNTLAQNQAAAALRKELTQVDDENEKADKLEKLEKQVFEEKDGVRNRIGVDRADKNKDAEERDRILDRSDKDKYFQEDQEQDNSGKNRQNQQEVIEDDDTLAINRLKQQAIAEVEELVEDENVVDEIEEVNVEDIKQKESRIVQVSAERVQSLETSESDREKAVASQDRVDEAKRTELKPREEVISKYTDNYRKYLMLPNKDLDGLMKKEEELLKVMGFTSRQIKDIQQAVKKTIKMEIRGKIEEAIIQKQLSVGNKLDSLTADTRLNKFTDYFVSNLLLGGQDFGGFDDNFQGLVNKAMYFASKNLANFSIEEMEGFVIHESMDPSKTRADKIKDFESKVSELNLITNNPKVTEEWAQTAMEVFMKDYGLAREKMNLPDQVAGAGVNVMSGGAGFNQGNQQKPKHDYEFDAKDEKDIFLNRLRALYLQRALNPGMSTNLKTEFKMRKMKNGLVRLGVFTEVLNEQVQKEAEEIAKDRTMDMLKEALEERASLYDLKGSAYDLIENKIKGVLKNADKLGMEISKDQFDSMRDEINFRMYETTKKQMELIEVRLSDADFPQLVVKYREMQRLIERLKEESKIDDNYGGNDKFHNITIAESA